MKSFLEWTKAPVFVPLSGVNVIVEILEHEFYTTFPLCEECKAKWVDSGLEKAIRDVKWHLIKGRKDVANLTCYTLSSFVLL